MGDLQKKSEDKNESFIQIESLRELISEIQNDSSISAKKKRFLPFVRAYLNIAGIFDGFESNTTTDGKIREWMEVALKDLNLADEMNKSEKYPYSVFLLQQGVEKTCKSWSLYYGLHTERGLRSEVSHIVIKSYFPSTKLFKQLKSNNPKGKAVPPPLLLMVSKFSNEINIDVTSWERILEILYSNEKDLSEESKKLKQKILDESHPRMDYDSIKSNLDFINQFSMPEDDIDECIGLAQIMLERLKIGMNNLKSISESAGKYFKLMCAGVLIALLTTPHEQTSRYPAEEGKNSLSPKKYNSDLGIVKATPEIISIAKEIIEYLNDRLNRIHN